jgi:hypothetical protein
MTFQPRTMGKYSKRLPLLSISIDLVGRRDLSAPGLLRASKSTTQTTTLASNAPGTNLDAIDETAS